MKRLLSAGLRRMDDSEVNIYQTSMNGSFQTPESMPEHTTKPAYSAEDRIKIRSEVSVRPNGELSPDTPIYTLFLLYFYTLIRTTKQIY